MIHMIFITQRYGIDYEEIFTPITCQETIRMLILIASQKKWTIHHKDVKNSFLNRYLEEEIYVEQPQSFEVLDKEHQVTS